MKINREKLGVATLCYLEDGHKYLLGKKKYGGDKGKVNGFGGKIEETDTDIMSAITREFYEETGATIINPTLSGIVEIYKENVITTVFYLFKASRYSGKPQESNEMKVFWRKKSNLPLDKMWASDSLWFPIFVRKNNILIKLYFDNFKDTPDRMDISFNQKLDENHHEKYL